MLKISNISKSYRSQGKEIHALKNLSFDVAPGEIVGLLGNNGSGKTTTIKIICGLLESDGGNVTVDGINIEKNRIKYLKKIGLIMEGNRSLSWRLSIEENCRYFGKLKMVNEKDIKRVLDDYLPYFDLADKRNELVGNLSRGMQQKASLIIALINQPKLLLLDEPFLGLDISSRNKFLSKVKKVSQNNKMSILMTSHQIEYIEEMCDKVVIIEKGEKLVEDNVENLLNNFMLDSYELVFLGQQSVDCNKLYGVIPNLTVEEKEDSIRFKFVSDQQQDQTQLWKIIDWARNNNLKLVELKTGRPELSYVFEKILADGGRRYA